MVGYSQPSGDPKLEVQRLTGEISADEFRFSRLFFTSVGQGSGRPRIHFQ